MRSRDRDRDRVRGPRGPPASRFPPNQQRAVTTAAVA